MKIRIATLVAGLAVLAGTALAQTPATANKPGADGAPPASTAQAPSSATGQSRLEAGFQGPLVVHFGTGSANVMPQDEALLDQASRLYREGHPLAMILTGGTDSVGSPEANLRISQQRTAMVLRGLVARGIPAERFQLLAKGESDPIVPTTSGTAQPENRRVEIRWR